MRQSRPLTLRTACCLAVFALALSGCQTTGMGPVAAGGGITPAPRANPADQDLASAFSAASVGQTVALSSGGTLQLEQDYDAASGRRCRSGTVREADGRYIRRVACLDGQQWIVRRPIQGQDVLRSGGR